MTVRPRPLPLAALLLVVATGVAMSVALSGPAGAWAPWSSRPLLIDGQVVVIGKLVHAPPGPPWRSSPSKVCPPPT